MTLFELGNQYLEQEKTLREKVKHLRKYGNMATDGDRRRLYYLQTEMYECRAIGNYLVNYYNRESEHHGNKAFTV